MKLVLLLVVLMSCVSCTTFYQNSSSVNKACKSGVQEYDDGTVNFKCFELKEKK